MSQLLTGITIKPYSINKKREKIITFSVTLSTEKLKAPFRFINNLYRKSVLNDFGNIFSSPVE